MDRICLALDRSSTITFILPGINLARMEMLSAITENSNNLASFHRDQSLAPPHLIDVCNRSGIVRVLERGGILN